MTGNYGGEVLRRVRAFKPVSPGRGSVSPEFLTHVQGCWSTCESLVRTHPLTFAVFRQAPWHHYGLLALEQTQLSLRSPFLDNDFIQIVFRAPESASLSNDVCLRLIAEGNPSLFRSGRIAGLPATMAVRREKSRAGCSSRLRLNTPTTMVCPSGSANRSCAFAASPRTALPWPPQVLSLPHLVSRCSRQVRPGNAAR